MQALIEKDDSRKVHAAISHIEDLKLPLDGF